MTTLFTVHCFSSALIFTLSVISSLYFKDVMPYKYLYKLYFIIWYNHSIFVTLNVYVLRPSSRPIKMWRVFAGKMQSMSHQGKLQVQPMEILLFLLIVERKVCHLHSVLVLCCHLPWCGTVSAVSVWFRTAV